MEPDQSTNPQTKFVTEFNHVTEMEPTLTWERGRRRWRLRVREVAGDGAWEWERSPESLVWFNKGGGWWERALSDATKMTGASPWRVVTGDSPWRVMTLRIDFRVNPQTQISQWCHWRRKKKKSRERREERWESREMNWFFIFPQIQKKPRILVIWACPMSNWS